MRRIFVTGANKGIGFAIAERILEEADDTVVFLGSRSLSRGEAAAEKLCSAEAGRNGRVQVVEIDVSSDESVGRASRQVRESCGDGGLYAVVNNAGIGLGMNELSRVLDVNARGVQRVCSAFIPLLGDNGRIVNITSAAGPNFVSTCSPEMQAFFTNPDVTWDEIEEKMNECVAISGDADGFSSRGLGDGSPYGLSKAFANVLTLHLAREYPQFVINSCTPGFIATDLTLQYANERGKSPQEMGMKSPREGAGCAIFLLFGKPEGSGHYYGSDAKRSPLDRYREPGTPAYTGE